MYLLVYIHISRIYISTSMNLTLPRPKLIGTDTRQDLWFSPVELVTGYPLPSTTNEARKMTAKRLQSAWTWVRRDGRSVWMIFLEVPKSRWLFLRALIVWMHSFENQLDSELRAKGSAGCAYKGLSKTGRTLDLRLWCCRGIGGAFNPSWMPSLSEMASSQAGLKKLKNRSNLEERILGIIPLPFASILTFFWYTMWVLGEIAIDANMP